MPEKNRDIRRLLEAEGFLREASGGGSHVQYEHPVTGMKLAVYGRDSVSMSAAAVAALKRNVRLNREILRRLEKKNRG